MKTLVFYDSLGGNTEHVAKTIHETVAASWGNADIVKVRKETAVNFTDYDLILIGSPVIDWLPTKKLMEHVMGFMKTEEGAVRALTRPTAQPLLPPATATFL